MAFKKGHPKLGGRKPGSVNKIKSFVVALQELKFDIPGEAVKLYKTSMATGRADIAARMLEFMANYTFAKPKEEFSAQVLFGSNPHMQEPEDELIGSLRESLGYTNGSKN